MPNVTVNYLAVVVAALAGWILGALWYSPALFGRQWTAAQGYTPEKLAELKQRGMSKAYVVTLICMLVTAWVLAALIHRLGILGALGGLKIGAVAWLGFAAPIGLTGNMFSEKPFSIFLIDTTYQLVFLVIMGVILAVWK